MISGKIDMETYFTLGLACGAITFTTSTTSIFKWFRELLSKIHPKIEELVHCPWCSNFWLVLLVVLTSNTTPVQVFDIYWLNILVTIFLIMAFSGLLHYVLLLAYKPVAEASMMRLKEKMQKQRQKNSSE